MKKIVLKSECEYHQSSDYISVCVFRVESTDDERWPLRTIICYQQVKLKTIFGWFKSPQQLAKEIAKTQNKMLADQKRNGKYYTLVRKLASAYTGGEVVVQDPALSKMVQHFSGDNK